MTTRNTPLLEGLLAGRGRLASFSRRRRTPTAPIGLLALTLVATLLGMHLWNGFDHTRSEIRVEIRSHANVMGEHVERTLEAVQAILSSVASDAARTDWDQVQRSHHFWLRLRDKAAGMPQMRSIWLADAEGEMRVFSDSFPSPQMNLQERPYFAGHVEGAKERRLIVGDSRQGRFTGRPFVPVSVPVLRSQGALHGVVAAAIEPDYYFPLLTAYGSCDHCRAALMRGDGHVLFAASPSGSLEEDFIDGLSAMWVSKKYPVVVAVWVPESIVWQEWWVQHKGAAGLGVAGLLLLVWVVHRETRRSVRLVRDRDRFIKLTEALKTKNRELEEARRDAVEQREAAASASRAKSAFLARMSHELRTPLNAIIGFSDLMLSQPKFFAHDRPRAYVADIKSSGEHLLALIKDILDLSKIEAGRFELEESEVDLPRLAKGVTRALMPCLH